MKYAHISEAENLPESTIRSMIKKANTRLTFDNNARTGRPRIRNQRDERAVLRAIREQPKLTYKQLKQATGLEFSTSTFKRILKENGITNWRCKRRPHLTQAHATARLNWALLNQQTDWLQWLFSDECSVEKGVGKRVEWAFGYPSEKWEKKHITTYSKGKQGSVMVWACIGTSVEETELVIMDRDGTSLRNRYTTESYLDALEIGLLPIYTGQVFMEDNAPIHMSGWARITLQNWGVITLTGAMRWPPYSPDLNPIEHL
nr:transposable element tcb2 transposase [Quercus suber]